MSGVKSYHDDIEYSFGNSESKLVSSESLEHSEPGLIPVAVKKATTEIPVVVKKANPVV